VPSRSGAASELGALLARLDSLESLRGLLAALGHEPLSDVVPGLALRGAGAPGPLLVVGRAGDFPWFAVAGGPAERLARRVACRLGARGRSAGVLALDGASRRLGVAVAFAGTPSVEVSLDRPAAPALASLARLAGGSEGGGLAYAARAAEALSGEAVGHRFFREFRLTLDAMAAALPCRLRGDDRRSLALLQLTRVLFLYFIQAKGWLGGRERFLAEAVDACLARKRHIHRDLLRPLFFGTLNRPAHERTAGARQFGPMPFLNGGLFEPHPLERALHGDIPNPVWRDAFERLFERFHFVVAEGGEAGGIAPDMLGRVFEGVMAPDARRATGTYYTPAALVRALVESAVIGLVAGRTGCAESVAARRLADRDPTTVAQLDTITLLDPAAGSGAFLLGALEHLSALTAAAPGGVSAARRRILRRTLFGVDRSATAVRLTELRLWLSVIADDPADRPDAVEPLPNLDCLVRQGDSLFDPVGGRLLGPAEPRLAEAVAAARRALVTAIGTRKRELVRELRAAECRAADATLLRAETEARARVRECLEAARSIDLFGHRRGVDRELRERMGELRVELRTVRQARRAILRDRELPWFQYHSHFADVFAAGGFDLVVGNPPWLRAEDIPAATRRQLAGRYRWWRGGRTAFGHRPDLALAFLERATELTGPGGVIALLVPAKLATAQYGAAARHELASATTLLRVADLTGQPVAAFDATVYPLAVVARKAAPSAGHRVAISLTGATGRTVPQVGLRGGGPWILLPDRVRQAAVRLAREHPTVADRLVCRLGVKTGANRIFLDPPATVEPELLRWAVRGRDLRPFQARPVRRLLWPHDDAGAPLVRLPPGAAAYLGALEPRLRARVDYAGGPPWALFRTAAAAARHRLVWADLGRRLTACALTDGRAAMLIPLNTCYIAPTGSTAEAERLAAWLNSTWLRAVARLGAVPASGGFFRFTAAVVGRLPLPASVLTDSALLEAARSGRGGEPVQEAIDDIAAEHLALSPRDRTTLARLVAGAAHRR
jgi:Eco57I restriction-modification methylase